MPIIYVKSSFLSLLLEYGQSFIRHMMESKISEADTESHVKSTEEGNAVDDIAVPSIQDASEQGQL